ncbi:MAG: DUF1800 domain-containing protein [Phycisphaerales bacterium]|nr:DUF1800 domain-containing protein [Phycisphaerales bacterium]
MDVQWMLSRRQFVGTLGVGAAGATVLGCLPAAPMPLPPSEMTSDINLRLLNRITFGPKTEDIARINEIGYEAFLEEQLSPETMDDGEAEGRLFFLGSLNADPQGLAGRNANVVAGELIAATTIRAVYSKRQLFERMVEFWTDHFSINQSAGNELRYLKTIDDREVIRTHALGYFRELLRASAKSPAMLLYLDNNSNVAGAPNENYAREAMELHTLSVNGNYTQQDVEELSRALTGWTVVEEGRDRGRFIFRPENHDDGPKQILDLSLPAGGGIGDGELALDYLARHPSTASFIATKLVQRFISENAPDGLVSEVAKAFSDSDGDIRATLRVLLSQSAMAQAGPKFKRPFHLYVDALRRVGADLRIVPRLARSMEIMGQVPFQWPAPNGYPDVATYWAPGLLSRWNFATNYSDGRLPEARIDPRQIADVNGVADPEGVVALWDQMFFGSEMPDGLRQALLDYINEAPNDNRRKFAESFALAMSSPEFQWY